MALSDRQKLWFDFFCALVLCFATRPLEQLLRHLIAADYAVGGPQFGEINMDTNALLFLGFAVFAWIAAEFLVARLRLVATNAVLFALGLFYLGSAFTLALGEPTQAWPQQAADQIAARLIGMAVFGVLYYLRFRISIGAQIGGLLLSIVWFVWFGFLASYEGGGLLKDLYL